MNNLFIIGNGFDLSHRLKTSYRDFREFLVQMEKEECAEAGEVSISDDPDILKDDNIKRCFEDIVIPEMTNALFETADIAQLRDSSTGKIPMEQMGEIERFLNDANKIDQWIRHGSGQYYVRESQESNAIKRLISLLEPETGVINHNTSLDGVSVYWQVIESEFGAAAVKFLQSDNGADRIPFWLTLRLFVKMIDAVEGEDWKDLETSMGTYNFEIIFDLFDKLESSDDIYKECVRRFLTDLYYRINVLFSVWVFFTEIETEHSAGIGDGILSLRPRIKKKNSGIELSVKINNAPSKGELIGTSPGATPRKHVVAKKQLIEMFTAANRNYFLTFNYTQTLERFYGISEDCICHIHGASKSDVKNVALDDLIFGHGRESFGANVTDVVGTAYNITKKPVKRCMEGNRLFFEKLRDVDTIYSYGFSFGDVDMVYIDEICRNIRDTANVTWYFNDFKIEENRALYEAKIRKAGFNGVFGVFHVD